MISNMYYTEQSYYDEYETFCYQNCIRQVLEYYGVNNAFLYINACMSIVLERYSELEYKIFFDKNAYGVLPCVKSLVIRKNDDRDMEVVWNDNKEYIANDYPVIVTVDSYYVEHLPFYGKSHGRHCMIAVGEDKEMPVVIDWNAPWYYKGKVKKEEFFISRCSSNEADGSVFSGDGILKNWAIVKKNGWEFSQDTLIEEFIEISKSQYKGAEEANKFVGINAYIEIKRIVSEIGRLNQMERKSELRKLYNSLYWIVRKKFFFTFHLKQIIEKDMMKSSICEKVLSESRILANEWQLFLNYLLKGSFVASEGVINKIVERLDELILKEREFSEAFLKI